MSKISKAMKALAFSVAALASFGAWAETEMVDGITWSYQVSDGKAEIYNNNESAAIPISTTGAITIPAMLGGYPVTSIGSSAFIRCSELAAVTIPDSVTSIGNKAFFYCSGLTSVTIPGSVTSIGQMAFHGCSGLASVTIEDGVTSIGDSAFGACSGLTSVTIPNSVTSLSTTAFDGCGKLWTA